MKKNDFRCGIFVRYSNTIFRVTQILKGALYLEHPEGGYGSHKFEAVEGIELTPEILVNNCGFKKDKTYCFHHKKFRHLILWENQTGFEFLFYGQNGASTQIENLHSLQNWFYALTGEELTIKGLI